MNTFLLIIGFLIGVFTLYGSIKGKFVKYKPENAKQEIIKRIFGSHGQNIVYGFIGAVIILVCGFFLFHKFVTLRLSPEFINKTDQVTVYFSGGPAGEAFKLTTVYGLDYEYLTSLVRSHRLTKVSFKNNYLEEIPKAIWDMSTLEILDLTNNKIQHFPKDIIGTIDSLKKIILIGNPIDSLEIDELRKENQSLIIEF